MSNLFSDLHLLVPLLLILGIAVGILVYRVLNGGAASSGFNADQRTSAYAGYQRVRNDNGAALGTAVNAGLLPVAGGDANALIGGITHKF